MTDDIKSLWASVTGFNPEDLGFVIESSDRFLIVPSIDSGKMIFLTDYKFWADHEKELDDWCEKNNCERKGMVVSPRTEKELNWFILRWS